MVNASDYQTERATLSCLFARPELLDITLLSVNTFASPICREIFRAMQFLRDRGMVVNAITVHEYIKHKSLPDDIKSLARIAEIETHPIVSDESVLRTYERLLIENWRVRSLKAAHEKARLALEEGEDVDQVQAQFERDTEPVLEASSGGLTFRSPREICESAPAKTPFIWEGYIAPGCITEISGAAKRSGKTTVQLFLVSAILDGRPFLGLPTSETNVVYLTEEGNTTFAKALRKSGLASDDRFRVLQWNDASSKSWPEIVRAAVRECRRIKAGLLFIDTLPQFAQLSGDSEKNDGDARELLSPLLKASADGLAIVMDRHERKGGGQVGESSRGSSQFTHGVDVILSLRRPEDKSLGPNVRVIHALSRFDETPETLTIELTDEGYAAVDSVPTTRKQAEGRILDALPFSEGDAITADETYKAAELKRTIAYQALDSLVKNDAVRRIGAGKRGDPFKYHKSPDSIRPPIGYSSRTNESDVFIRRDTSNAAADEYDQAQASFTGNRSFLSGDDSSVDEFPPGAGAGEVCDACGCKSMLEGWCYGCGAMIPVATSIS